MKLCLYSKFTEVNLGSKEVKKLGWGHDGHSLFIHLHENTVINHVLCARYERVCLVPAIFSVTQSWWPGVFLIDGLSW